MGRAGVRAAILLLLAGCGAEPPPPPPPPTPAAPQEKPPDLPPFGEARLTEFSAPSAGDFPAVPAPDPVPELRWDFGPDRRHAYEFGQTLYQVTVTVQGRGRGVASTRDRRRGVFEFAARQDHTARTFVKIETEESVTDGTPAPKEFLDKQPPTLFECVVREDGVPLEVRKSEGAEANAQMFFDTLLPLRLGERAAAGGKFSTRITGWFKVERWECARLETDFETTLENESGKTLLRGRTVAYFAHRERFFVRAETGFAQSTRVRAKEEAGWKVSAYDSETSCRLKRITPSR